MQVALVIPVWNDPEGLVRLLVQAQELAWVSQIVVADDASDPPCGPGMAGLPAAVAADARLLWLRSDTRRGPGHGRNHALDHVTAEHVLFFDSDDLFLPAMTDLMQALDGRRFDFCLFRHVDSRTRGTSSPGPMPDDEALWQEAGATEPPAPLRPGAETRLCGLAAYPWNKIYRTAFLRAHAIRCTPITVHEDIELHWLSFLHGRDILVSRHAGCEHVVHEAGDRLTNRRGRIRLEAFTGLDAVQAALRQHPRGPDFLAPFTDFTLRLFDWISAMIEPELQAEFADRARRHLRDTLPEAAFTLLALRDPALAGRVIRRIWGTSCD
jgi:glycosyltransferase involved in cell wall biosynthesis